jgi:hypothetical protein
MGRNMDGSAAKLPLKQPVERRRYKNSTAEQTGQNRTKPSPVRTFTAEERAAWAAAKMVKA